MVIGRQATMSEPQMIRTEFPHPVEEIENAWLALSDGTRLAVRLWLPEGSLAEPVPAVLEYLPYRKDDGTAWQDSTRHPYFAGFGYAAVRVDMRGTGDSDGILLDEYLKLEQDDALEVIAWIAEQPWCSGEVGMSGYSWGGFNGLQIAARRPPALKAIVTAYSTDNRYTDDCHHQGGCVLGSDLLKWATTMRAINALPPDPRFRADWREVWLDRLERTPAYIEPWLTHQRYDAYWKQGSVAEDYAAIQAAVYAVGGWADPYTNAVPRLIEHLTCPRKGLIGPWKHVLPYRGRPEPIIGFLQECVRWFDRHLKGVDNGIDREPTLTVWMQDPLPPATDYDERPGRWVAFDGWPASAVREESWLLGAEGDLAPQPQPPVFSAEAVRVLGDQTTGVGQGVWCPNGMAEELPGDQREDDRRSLLFDSAPLAQRLELLGTVEAVLDLTVDQPLALMAVRLCDVAPDGASALVTWGLMNLTHRHGHESPEPLVPGERFTVRVPLNCIGQAIEAGHRIRFAISPTYWPSAWPSPVPVDLSVHVDGSCQVRLPVLEPGHQSLPAPSFGPPERARSLELFDARSERSRSVKRDGECGGLSMTDVELREQLLAPTGTRDTQSSLDVWSIGADPLTAVARCERTFELQREGWAIRVRTVAQMRAESDAFEVEDLLEAFEAEGQVFGRKRVYRIPRDMA